MSLFLYLVIASHGAIYLLSSLFGFTSCFFVLSAPVSVCPSCLHFPPTSCARAVCWLITEQSPTKEVQLNERVPSFVVKMSFHLQLLTLWRPRCPLCSPHLLHTEPSETALPSPEIFAGELEKVQGFLTNVC